MTPADVWCDVPKKSQAREGAERNPSEPAESDVADDDAAAARQRARERAGDDDLPRKAGRTNSGGSR
jgi:hypothetical protein